MILHGVIRGQAIHLDEDPGVPDGSRVEVVIRPVQQEKLIELLRQLEAQGLLRLPPNPTASQSPMPEPVVISGEPLSQTIIEGRG